MPYKNRETQLAAQRAHYRKNKHKWRQSMRDRKLFRLRFATRYKILCGCFKCGEKHPACLEFHHKNRKMKTKNVSVLIMDRASMSRIKDEIRKCEVVCRNCHAKIHYGQKFINTTTFRPQF